jgi:hypothetical protein
VQHNISSSAPYRPVLRFAGLVLLCTLLAGCTLGTPKCGRGILIRTSGLDGPAIARVQIADAALDPACLAGAEPDLPATAPLKSAGTPQGSALTPFPAPPA